MEANMYPLLTAIKDTMPVIVNSGRCRHGGAGGKYKKVDRGDEGDEDELQIRRDPGRRSRQRDQHRHARHLHVLQRAHQTCSLTATVVDDPTEGF
jgi:hypothetical protein